jgi:hypothetical protein
MRYAIGLLATVGILGPGALRAEDDLALIRKAVAQAEPVAAAAPAPAAAVATPRAEPKWLRVRVEPKGDKKGRVRVNIPLAFVKAVGDNLPMTIGEGCRREHREAYCGLKLSEVLKTLEGGEDIVEIDDEQQTVRIWLE